MMSTPTFPQGGLPEALGMRVTDEGEGWIEMAMPLGPIHMRPGEYRGIHAGTAVSLADTACGFGCRSSLPETATAFITIELKSNLLSSAERGELLCRAEAIHLGRTTQVWQATVTSSESGKKVAVFQCTQLVIYPKP
ncbi:MAG: PaaI family thioesterase [Pseudomonadota bacterium]|nr:PaaI family thioesterase [Pseudomonadota bacterium]